MVWAVRLGGFLLFRVLKTGGDSRFDEVSASASDSVRGVWNTGLVTFHLAKQMRSQFFKFAGFWTFQLIWVGCL